MSRRGPTSLFQGYKSRLQGHQDGGDMTTRSGLDPVHFKSGAFVFREGDVGDAAFIISSGMVDITITRGDGDALLSRLGPGDIFGEMAVIDERPRSANAIVHEDCQLIPITREALNQRLDDNDSIVTLLLKVVLRRYRSTLQRYVAHQPLPDFSEFQVESKVRADAIEEMRLENELRRALDQDELRAFYQPIVDLQTRKIAGFEALVRWFHPTQGMIPPFKFIDLAEQTGLIIPLGDLILAHACRDLEDLQKACREGFGDDALAPFMSVNVSGRQLEREDFARSIADTVRTTGVNPTQVKLEITESAFVDDPQAAMRWIDECKKLGLSIALDDFGTGFSSLGYLHQFQVDVLKIDRCFINAMGENERAAQVVRAVAGLAQGLNLVVVAEGIEESHQIQALADLDCELGQGYLFSKPLDLASMCDLLRSGPDWQYESKE